jgi:hypothetical protein
VINCEAMAAPKRNNGKAKSKAGETEENNENGEEETQDEINKKNAEEEKKKAEEQTRKAEEEKTKAEEVRKRKASEENNNNNKKTAAEKEKLVEMEEELEALRTHNNKLQQYVDAKRQAKEERKRKEKEAGSKYREYLNGETFTAGIGIVNIRTANTTKYKDALGMVSSVPMFKGRSGESFQRFKMKFDFALVGEELLEIDFIRLLVSKLTDVALDFYNEMTRKFPGRISSAEGLVQVMTSKFINTETQSNALEELDALQMGSSTVEEYHLLFNPLAQMSGHVSDQQLAKSFINGLRPSLKQKVKHCQGTVGIISKMEDALKYALRYELLENADKRAKAHSVSVVTTKDEDGNGEELMTRKEFEQEFKKLANSYT